MIPRLRQLHVLLLIMLIGLHALAPHELVLCFVKSGDAALELGRAGRCLGAALPEDSACTAPPEPEAQSTLTAENAGCRDVMLTTLEARRPERMVQASGAAVACASAAAPPSLCALRLLPALTYTTCRATHSNYGYASMLLTTSLRI